MISNPGVDGCVEGIPSSFVPLLVASALHAITFSKDCRSNACQRTGRLSPYCCGFIKVHFPL